MGAAVSNITEKMGWRRGEQKTFLWSLPAPVSGSGSWVVEFFLKASVDDESPLLQLAATPNEGAGTFSVDVTAAQTEDLDDGVYIYALARTDAGAEQDLAVGDAALLNSAAAAAFAAA